MGLGVQASPNEPLEQPSKKAKTAAESGAAGALGDPLVTRATAHFMRDDVPFGAQACETEAKGRQGFEVGAELMEAKEVLLEPIPADAKLETHGVELLNVKAQLEAAGVREDSIDASNKDHRMAVGRVLIAAAEARFGPGRRGIHMADTSRVSGASVYGEATVRDTAVGKKLRAAHHAFHMDKFLPGVAKFWGHQGTHEGAKDFVDTYWQHWEQDFSSLGVSKEGAVKCVEDAAPGLVNLWVSLTPGEIEQQPLAVADRRTLRLGDFDLDKVSTVPVTFPTLKDTLTLLRSGTVPGTRWLWRPKMKFGEVLLFSTVWSPHSAVYLPDSGSEKSRQSAEMRIFIVEAE